MWKIIRKSVEKIVVNKKKFSLWMKWEFKIEFASDSFWPYKYKFQREDCYFTDALDDRGTKLFPLKNKKFKNTEVFLETDDIVIALWKRWRLVWWEKTFIDIINIKTEKKYRLFTTEVNLIYNEKDNIIINTEKDWLMKTLKLNINSLEKIEEKEEWLYGFFKCIYNNKKNRWYRLDFFPLNTKEKDIEKKHKLGYFNLKQIKDFPKPVKFDRRRFKVEQEDGLFLDVWEESFR